MNAGSMGTRSRTRAASGATRKRAPVRAAGALPTRQTGDAARTAAQAPRQRPHAPPPCARGPPSQSAGACWRTARAAAAPRSRPGCRETGCPAAATTRAGGRGARKAAWRKATCAAREAKRGAGSAAHGARGPGAQTATNRADDANTRPRASLRSHAARRAARRTTTVTECPSLSSRNVACEPMKPAPPCARASPCVRRRCWVPSARADARAHRDQDVHLPWLRTRHSVRSACARATCGGRVSDEVRAPRASEHRKKPARCAASSAR